jgi:HEAT repeat protein
MPVLRQLLAPRAGRMATPELAARLAAGPARSRRRAAEALARRPGDRAAATALAGVLGDADEVVRHLAARGLAAQGDLRGLRAMLGGLRSADGGVRRATTAGLAALGPEQRRALAALTAVPCPQDASNRDRSALRDATSGL